MWRKSRSLELRLFNVFAGKAAKLKTESCVTRFGCAEEVRTCGA